MKTIALKYDYLPPYMSYYWPQAKEPILFDFCIHEFGSNIHLGCEGFVTPQSLLEVRIGLDMMINLKRHLDSSVQTATQKHLSRYYGQDTQLVTT